MSKMTKGAKEPQFWSLLKVFESEIRIAIIRLLVKFEWQSLSEIARKLEANGGWKISLPGLLKHMKELEGAGIVRHESGIYGEKPDARKTLYILEGKERIQKILEVLEEEIAVPVMAGATFNEAFKLARRIQGIGHMSTTEEKEALESLIAKCESEEIETHLTEDEKKKVRLWKMMMTVEEHT